MTIHDGFDYNPDAYDDWQKVTAVIGWAKAHPKFNAEFIHAIRGRLERFNSLTVNQVSAVDNIIRRWQIKVEDYKSE